MEGIGPASTLPKKHTESREMPDPVGLRKLAAWYREFTEHTGNPTIWEARLCTAKELETEAGRIEVSVGHEADTEKDERAMPNQREQAIRERAYAIWEQEGHPDGRGLAHWLQAEAEIQTNKIVGVTDDGKFIQSQPRVGVPRRRRA
jgi:hypothetical protein